MQSKASKAPTVAERERLEAIPYVGCIACAIVGRYQLAQVHHITDCGRRIRKKADGTEHRYTLGLCPWHHQGQLPAGWSPANMVAAVGPSLELDKRGFMARFGTEADLLELQDALIRNDTSIHRALVDEYARVLTEGTQ